MHIIKKIRSLFGLQEKSSISSHYHIPTFLQTPFHLPHKKWPHFLFKNHNRVIENQHGVFNHYDRQGFIDAYINLDQFQKNKHASISSADILQWIHREENEIEKLKTSFQDYLKLYPNTDDHYSRSVSAYLRMLNAVVGEQRRHPKISLYLEHSIRVQLQTIEATLTHIFNNLDDQSIQNIPQKLKDLHAKMSSIAKEIEHLSEFASWYQKLSSAINNLLILTGGKANFSREDIRAFLLPWFSNFDESALFLEKCTRQLFIHFVMPNQARFTTVALNATQGFQMNAISSYPNKFFSKNSSHHEDNFDSSADHQKTVGFH